MAEAGWLGITMPAEVRRRRPGRHRGGDHDARGGQPRRRHGGGLGGAHQPVRAAPDRRLRHAPSRRRAGCRGWRRGWTRWPSASPSPTPASTPPPSRPSRTRSTAATVVHGQKVWTSTAQVAGKIMLLTRTTRLEDCARPTDGITIFYTDLDRSKHRRAPHRQDGPQGGGQQRAVHRRPVHPRSRPHRRGRPGLRLPAAQPEPRAAADRRRGHRHRPGRAAPRLDSYAAERVVFGRPIGQNQGIQHPLAERWMALEAAWAHGDEGRLAVRPAAALRRRGQCGQVPGRARRLRQPASRRC